MSRRHASTPHQGKPQQVPIGSGLDASPPSQRILTIPGPATNRTPPPLGEGGVPKGCWEFVAIWRCRHHTRGTTGHRDHRGGQRRRLAPSINVATRSAAHDRRARNGRTHTRHRRRELPRRLHSTRGALRCGGPAAYPCPGRQRHTPGETRDGQKHEACKVQTQRKRKKKKKNTQATIPLLPTSTPCPIASTASTPPAPLPLPPPLRRVRPLPSLLPRRRPLALLRRRPRVM